MPNSANYRTHYRKCPRQVRTKGRLWKKRKRRREDDEDNDDGGDGDDKEEVLNVADAGEASPLVMLAIKVRPVSLASSTDFK